MGQLSPIEPEFGSTTWKWKRVKIAQPPQANKHSATKSHRWRRLRRLDPRNPVTLTVRFRGGAECWVEVRARGEVNRYPGHASIYDLMADVWQVHKQD